MALMLLLVKCYDNKKVWLFCMSPLIPYGYLLEAQQSQKTKERKEIEKERQKRNRVRMKTDLKKKENNQGRKERS